MLDAGLMAREQSAQPNLPHNGHQDMTNFESHIALLWQEILRQTQDNTFAVAKQDALNRDHGLDKLPQPGLVGAHYRPGGILLLGQNPGNDRTGKGLSREDCHQYPLLEQLRDAPDTASALTASRDLMSTLISEVMPTWPIMRNVCLPLLALLRLELQDVAYINLVKFRTNTSKFKTAIYKASWNLTSRQIELLEPKYIIALGIETHRRFMRLYQGHAQVFRIARAIGDTRLSPQGRADIEYIKGNIFDHIKK